MQDKKLESGGNCEMGMIKPKHDGTVEDVLRRAVAYKRAHSDYDVVTIIALRLDKSPSTVYKWLSGDVAPSIFDVMAVFEVCEYSQGFDELKALATRRSVETACGYTRRV